MKTMYLSWGLLLLMTTIHGVRADQNTAILTVNVTINVPPCDINNNNTINIDFGNNVAVTDVAAGLVKKPINYTLECSNIDTSKSLKIMIHGTGADFDSNVLQTSIPDLAIQLQANGTNLPLNTNVNFANVENKPVLEALLVQKPGARLATGDFKAGATMTVDYQ